MHAPASTLASLAALLCVVGVMLRICWTDFFLLKIFNRDLLVLSAAILAYLLLRGIDDWFLRLFLAAVLFALSFAFWVFRTLGAGDVKLFGLTGLLIPPEQAVSFALLLLAFVAAMLLLLRKAEALRSIPWIAGRRAMELASTGRIPYGVPIALAGIVTVAPIWRG